ncbi:hypothetical protein [Pseudactinotalea sp. Z1748]|uniref:hypothetical protein n=1 Tax=Pseudactinotalea sp. Z1748 TaxID=3413027 RepID=UPI003C7BBB73
MSLPTLSRRSLMVGGSSTLALALLGRAPDALGAPAPAAMLDYTSPEAFAVAEQAYLDLGAQHNEAGLYAWGESYYLLGLLLMYERYEDEAYLDTFEERARHVLASTDAARGVTDYRGVSGPGWRAAGNYTAGHAEFALSDGSPGIQIRWAGVRSAEARATVTNVSGERFDLELSHPSSSETLTGVSLDPASPDYVVDAVHALFNGTRRWTALDHRESHDESDRVAASSIDFEPQFYVFSVHTGMVVRPLARYVRTVLGSPRYARRQAFAARVRRAVQEAVDFHWEEFAVDEHGRGDFWWARNAPIPWDGLMQPYNQGHAMGAVYAELYHLTPTASLRRRLEAMMRSFRAGVESDGDAIIWPYWQPYGAKYRGYTVEEDLSTYTPWFSGIRVAEDISHAAITLEFLQSVHDAGIEDLGGMRQQLATTFTQNVIRDEDSVWFRVDGTQDAAPANAVQSARWLMLDDVDPAIHDHVRRVYEAEPLEPSQGSHALGIAYLNHTA